MKCEITLPAEKSFFLKIRIAKNAYSRGTEPRAPAFAVFILALNCCSKFTAQKYGLLRRLEIADIAVSCPLRGIVSPLQGCFQAKPDFAVVTLFVQVPLKCIGLTRNNPLTGLRLLNIQLRVRLYNAFY